MRVPLPFQDRLGVGVPAHATLLAAQGGDVLLRIAELAEHRIGVVAQVRRRRAQRARRGRQLGTTPGTSTS
jgi:hypothetical protein